MMIIITVILCRDAIHPFNRIEFLTKNQQQQQQNIKRKKFIQKIKRNNILYIHNNIDLYYNEELLGVFFHLCYQFYA